MTRRKSLALMLLFWAIFALVLAEFVTSSARERIEELADGLGGEAIVDELGGGWLTTIWLALVLSISLILIMHWRGGLTSLIRKFTPSSRAQDHNRAGLAFFHQGGYAAAAAEFTEALRHDPGLTDARVNRGAAYFQMDRPELALADLDAALALRPTDLNALGWRGQVLSKMGEPDKALADYDEALRLSPDFPVALGNRALVWFQKKDHGRAMADLNRAIALGARDALLHATRGSLYLAMEEYTRALDDCTTAILLGQSGATDFSNRGMAWLGLKNYTQAINDFDDALRIDPRFALAYNNRGVARMYQGNYADAVADFHKARELDPELPNSYKNLAWLFATCPKAEFRDGPAAVALAEKALQLVDYQVSAWFAILAAAHAEAGHFADAAHWQTKCLEKATPQSKDEQEECLTAYRAGRPHRTSSPSTSR